MTFWYLPRSIYTIFLVVYEPDKLLECLQGVGFQDKNCFTKMVSNIFEINYGFSKHEKMNRKYYYDILVSAQVKRYKFFGYKYRALEGLEGVGFES